MHRWVIPLALTAACHSAATAAAARPAADAPAGPVLPHGHVTVHGKTGPAVFDVELALDAPAHERGLMWRKSVPDGTGMLFVFPEQAPHVFWMKNTLAALDMIFLSSDRRIVGIVENAEPLTTTPRDPHAASQYVLEVAGGVAFARGLRVGDQADFDGLPDH